MANNVLMQKICQKILLNLNLGRKNKQQAIGWFELRTLNTDLNCSRYKRFYFYDSIISSTVSHDVSYVKVCILPSQLLLGNDL